MLGESLGEEIGQITGTRVLPPENGAPVIEVSFQANGTLLGKQVTDIGTYRSVARPDGFVNGEGHGVIMAENGAVISWKGTGVGQPTGRGTGMQYRGAIYYQTADPSFARLTQCAGVFEYETDETGKTEGKIFEWK